MTIEQVKEEAKKRFDKDLTDEQAQKWLEAHPAGELQDEELADVAGGGCGGRETGDFENSSLGFPPCPRCGGKWCNFRANYYWDGGLLCRTEYDCAKCLSLLGQIYSDGDVYVMRGSSLHRV